MTHPLDTGNQADYHKTRHDVLIERFVEIAFGTDFNCPSQALYSTITKNVAWKLEAEIRGKIYTTTMAVVANALIDDLRGT